MKCVYVEGIQGWLRDRERSAALRVEGARLTKAANGVWSVKYSVCVCSWNMRSICVCG